MDGRSGKAEWRRSYLGDYGSLVRDLGMMVHLLIKHDLENTRARELAFELEREIRARRWLSTQERNALFLAGISLSGLPSKEWNLEIDVGDETYRMSNNAGASRLSTSSNSPSM